MTSPLARLRDRSRFVSCLAVVAVIVIALMVSTQVQVHPLQPTTLVSGQAEPDTVWAVGQGGSSPNKVTGTYTAYSTDILLNDIFENASASAEYTLPFAAAPSLHGLSVNFTVYILGQIDFADNSTPLTVTFNGHAFDYPLTHTQSVPWYPVPVYVPNPRDFVSLPSNVVGFPSGSYLSFSYLSAGANFSQSVTVSVPAHGQMYVEQIVAVAYLISPLVNSETERSVALLVLPLLILGSGLVLWLFWRLRVDLHLPEILAALALQLAIAPFFFHADLTGILLYPALLFNHSALNAGQWGYGPAWLAMVDVPFAVPFLFGAQPNAATTALLLKLPAILFGLLTYLLLVRILEPRFGTKNAEWYAIWVWLFNPLTIYFDSVHGLYESALAFFLLLFVWQLGKNSEARSAVALTLGALVLVPVYLASVGSFLIRASDRVRKSTILILPGIALVGALAVALFISGVPVSLSELSSQFSVIPVGGVSFGEATTSVMSFADILNVRFGIELSPFLGLATLASIVLGLRLAGISFPARSAATVTFASIVAFYFTYGTFYIQHVIWVLPIFALLLLNQTGNRKRALAVVWGLSLLGLAIDYGQVWWPAKDPYLAIPFFTVILLPISLSAAGRVLEPIERWLPLAGPMVGISVGLYVLLESWGALAGLAVGMSGVLTIVLVLILLAWLVGGRAFRRVGSSAVLPVAALGVSVAALYYLPATAPVLNQVLYCIVVGAMAWESLTLLKRWVEAETVAPRREGGTVNFVEVE